MFEPLLEGEAPRRRRFVVRRQPLDPEVSAVAPWGWTPPEISELADPAAPVRAAACRGLGLFAPDLGPAHVVGLVAALGDPADTVRVDALEALGELPTGPTAAAVSAATRLVRQGPTGEERRAAAALLSNGSALPDDAVRALIFAMTADVPTVQAAAAFALHVLLERGAAETQQRVSRALRALSPR